MKVELTIEALRERSRGLAWWSLGVAAIVLAIVLLYPSVRGVPGLDAYAENLPEALRALFAGGELDITSPTGYLNSELFGITIPLLLLIYGIGMGAAAVAGEEEQGMLDLVLAQPVARRRLVIERQIALVLACTALGFVTFATTVVGSALVDLDIAASAVAAASVSSVLLAVFFGTVAMAIGSIHPGRGRAVAITSGVAVASWLLDGLALVVGALEPWRPISPFYQLLGVNPLGDGAPWGGWALVVGLTILTVGVATAGLQRRDLR